MTEAKVKGMKQSMIAQADNKPKSQAQNVIGEEVFKPHIKKNLTPGANKEKASDWAVINKDGSSVEKFPRLHKSQEKEK